MERRTRRKKTVAVGAFGLRRNDTDGALRIWLRELRAGRSCYETTNMLLHMQDDPDELLAAMSDAATKENLKANPFPADDSVLVAALRPAETSPHDAPGQTGRPETSATATSVKSAPAT